MGEGSSVALLVGAMAPAAVCTWAGLQHTVDPSVLGAALRQPRSLRRVLGPRAAREVARLWGAVEIMAGVAVFVVLLVPAATGGQLPVLLSLTAMYTGFTAWLLLLWRRLPTATCGCGARAEPADRFAVLRAAVLGGCALAPTVALLIGQQLTMPAYGWLALPAAAALAVLLWILPTAMRPLEVAR